MVKKSISLILAFVLAFTVCAVAFADGETSDYNYKTDSNLTITTDVLNHYDTGEFDWGQYSPAYFYPLDKSVHTINEIPKVVDEETGEETDEDLYVDSTSCDPEYEIIRIAAFYVFECPNCGMAHGDFSLINIYSKCSGVCIGCQSKLPDPKTVKIYRYIVLDETKNNGSSHSTTMRYYDFSKYAKDVYGDTASLYGDGKDLPENSITFAGYGSSLPTRDNGEYDITAMATTSVKAETGDRLKAWLLVFLTKLQYKLGPKLANYADSSWAAFKNNVRVTFAGIWQNFLIAIVGG